MMIQTAIYYRILRQLDLNNKINRIKLGNMKPKRDYIDADDVTSTLNKMINYKKNRYSIFYVVEKNTRLKI